MRPTAIFRALALSAFVVLAARPAAAQSATQSAAAPAPSAAASEAWAEHPIGSYHLEIQLTDRVMPATVTIADSSGVPTGTILPEGDQDAHPVKITVKGTDLRIDGDADQGPFTIVLTHQGEQIAGTWSYGGENGKLTGKKQ
jgi:hypothetical protein